MDKPCISIIGLGLIGGSMGLALRASGKDLHVVGHDQDPGLSKLARKMGAVDEGRFNLPHACEDADLLVIATPITALRETLADVSPHLKPGCVVTDTAPLKGPVLAWAEETLPGVPFIAGLPVVNPAAQPTSLMDPQGLESARADLFQDALYALCAPPQADPKAVKRVTDMVNLLGARPFYVDQAELDGIQAVTKILPALLNLALLQVISQEPGWREARKLADHIFGMSTAPLAEQAASQRAQALLNAQHLLPRLEALVNQLTQLDQWIRHKDADSLEQAFERASLLRRRWLVDRARGEWEEEITELILPGALDSLGNLIGLRPPQPQEE
jgi:prephenate dehydrogenase